MGKKKLFNSFLSNLFLLVFFSGILLLNIYHKTLFFDQYFLSWKNLENNSYFENYEFGDGFAYINLSKNILINKEYSYNKKRELTAWRSPGYPILLSISHLIFGFNYKAFFWLNLFFSCLSIVVVYLILRVFFYNDKKIIIYDVILFAFFFIFNEKLTYLTCIPYTMTSYIFFYFLTTYFLLKYIFFQKKYFLLFFVVSLFITVNIRATFGVIFPITIFIFLFYKILNLKETFIIFIIFTLFLLPWGYRNYCHFGLFIPFNTNVSHMAIVGNNNFYIEDGLFEKYVVKYPIDFNYIREREEFIKNHPENNILMEYDMIRFDKYKFKAFLKKNPKVYFKNIIRRFIAFWIIDPPSQIVPPVDEGGKSFKNHYTEGSMSSFFKSFINLEDFMIFKISYLISFVFFIKNIFLYKRKQYISLLILNSVVFSINLFHSLIHLDWLGRYYIIMFPYFFLLTILNFDMSFCKEKEF